MYQAIVRRRVRALFARANAGDWAAIVDGLAPVFRYRFVGETSLGGVRTTRASMRQWWERLYRLFPGVQFAPETVVVHGPPWATTVMTHVHVRAAVPGGADGSPQPYENEFMQKMTLRWGKVTEIITLEDTQRLAMALTALADAGVGEAASLPILDPAVDGA